MEVTDIDQALSSLLFASLLALVTFFLAKRGGYFRLPPPPSQNAVTFIQTAGVFALFLLFQVVSAFALHFVPAAARTWSHIGLITLLLGVLIGYCFLINREARRAIFWGEGEKRLGKGILMGLVSWVVSYPFVFFSAILSSLISLLIWKEAVIEQVAVQQLKMTLGHPGLLTAMIVLVVFIVPFMEELLFRGFLQSWLRRHLGRLWGGLLTAAIFAVVHYAPSQGTGNFQLIISLFTLSLFLSFIYERQQTLWASITLHAAFNGFSVLLILLDRVPLF